MLKTNKLILNNQVNLHQKTITSDPISITNIYIYIYIYILCM